METLDGWITTGVGWIDAIPIEGWAILAGLVIGAGATQWIKRTFPINILLPNMSKPIQKMNIRLLAFAFSFSPTFFIWPDNNAIWAALAVGFSTPAVYCVGSFFTYKKWPELRDRFSGTEV